MGVLLPLLSHVLPGHPVRGQRANGTHYGPSVSCHYSHPIWGRVGTGLPRGQERVPPSERLGPVSQQAALHPETFTRLYRYLSSSAGIAYAVPRFKTATLPPEQRGVRG